MNQSVNQSVNQFNQSINQSITQSINQSIYLLSQVLHVFCSLGPRVRVKVPKQTLWGARARAGTKLKRFFIFFAWKETRWVSIAICVYIIVQIYIYIYIYIYCNTHLDILHMHMYICDLLQPLGLAPWFSLATKVWARSCAMPSIQWYGWIRVSFMGWFKLWKWWYNGNVMESTVFQRYTNSQKVLLLG